MNGTRTQAGFSLIEVLFAVLVLTLGLVFVASQFPIALSQSYDIAQTTANPIFAQNAEIEAELQITNVINKADPNFFGDGAAGAGRYIDNRTNMGSATNPFGPVLYLPTVNFRPFYNDMIMDNPVPAFGAPWSKIFIPIYATSPTWANFNYFQNPPAYSFNTNYLPPTINIYNTANQGPIGRGNLGLRVSPQVTPFDPAVADVMRQKSSSYTQPPFTIPPYAGTPDVIWWDLNDSIFQVAQKRKFCHCVFYQCIAPSATGGRNFRMLIFTIKLLENQRYALQDNSFANWIYQPAIYAAPQDRWLPVPFYVALQNPITPSIRYQNIFANLNPLTRIDLTGNDVKFSGASASAAYSQFPAEICSLLRPGSMIINAVSGELLEIEEAYEGGFKLRQPMPFTDSSYQLQYFWVIPPPLTPARNAFGDNQLVVDVAEKIIKL